MARHRASPVGVEVVSVSLSAGLRHASAHYSESGSSQAGHQSSDPDEERTFLMAAKLTC